MRLLLVLVLVGILAVCASTRETARPLLEGQWEYTMRNPTQGTLSGMMTILQGEDGNWTGRVTVREMNIDEAMAIQNVELDGNAFTLNGSAANSSFTMSGTVKGT